jgi:ferredoxin
VVFLAAGVFIGRPYCRFLCPYGALLKIASTVSRWRVRTTPDYCTQCRLCEHACPYGAMREPSAGTADPQTLGIERKRLAWLLLATPVLILVLGWVGYNLSHTAALLHPKVALAEKSLQNRIHPVAYTAQSPEALELIRASKDPKALFADVAAARAQFRIGGWLLGGWIGLVLGAKLISLSVRRQRTDFEPDRGACLACARCFEYCPNERVRRGLLPAESVERYVRAQLEARTPARPGSQAQPTAKSP